MQAHSAPPSSGVIPQLIPRHWRTPPGTPNAETFVAIGDCLGGGKMVGHGGTTDGRFFVEVFVPWGSDLTLCAASRPGPGQPSTLYGKAKIPMHAEKTGEVEFKNVVVEVAKGPPKSFDPTGP